MSEEMEPPTQEQHRQITSLLHAIQSGVAWEHARGSEDGSAKHLRVGVNSSLVAIAAVTKLLIRKGLISSGEYWDIYIEQLEEEVDRYEARAPENVHFR